IWGCYTDEEDHSEFCMLVFPKIENLKGEHMLELVNKDVKFAKLDDEDAVRICLLLALDFVFMGHELRHVVSKPIRSSLDYFKKVTRSIPVLRSATKGSSKGKSVHTHFLTEVRHEVHVHTEVSKVHSKEELHVPAIEKKDIQERDELLKTVKEEKQTFLDLQLRLNSVEEKLKPGLLDVDPLDKSMGGVNQCMNVDDPYKNWNDVSDNFHADGLDHKSVRDDVNVNSVVKEDIVKDDVNADSLVKEDIEKDDVNVDSLVKDDIEKDDVHVDSVVKDAKQIENETLPC
nr:phospholipase-like protein [Tanacetum cinerariifolium]